MYLLQVVEPEWIITSSATPDMDIDAGDEVAYNFTLYPHSASSPAYRLIWQTVVPAVYLDLHNWTIAVVSSSSSSIDNTSNPNLSWRLVSNSTTEYGPEYGPEYAVIVVESARISLTESIILTFVANATQRVVASAIIGVLSSANYSSLPSHLDALPGRSYATNRTQSVRRLILTQYAL